MRRPFILQQRALQAGACWTGTNHNNRIVRFASRESAISRAARRIEINKRLGVTFAFRVVMPNEQVVWQSEHEIEE